MHPIFLALLSFLCFIFFWVVLTGFDFAGNYVTEN
jgi:hypothetical protein